MSGEELKRVANNADFIVNGYAFSKLGDDVRVINLDFPDRAAVLSPSGDVIETTMDDLELDIVHDYLLRNAEFLVD